MGGQHVCSSVRLIARSTDKTAALGLGDGFRGISVVRTCPKRTPTPEDSPSAHAPIAACGLVHDCGPDQCALLVGVSDRLMFSRR